jgi:hypothetical protein
MNLRQLKQLFIQAGAEKLYAKPLSENDNSKNQVYFGLGFQSLHLFPNDGILPDNKNKKIFKAKLRFGWLLQNGMVADAPEAQLILYPQYPEVRFSGFLKRCTTRPSSLMAERMVGRILFLGVTNDGRIIGFVVSKDSEVAADYLAQRLMLPLGVFFELSLPKIPDESESRKKLLAELGRVHHLGWIDSKQLDSNKIIKGCNAPQCGGFTLEAELGIPKNSKSVPDFLGWEIKQHNVSNFRNPYSGGAITLLTPEPTGGFYAEHGGEAFIRKFGYPDRNGRLDRLNFCGVHRVGKRHASTDLELILDGYNALLGIITDNAGAVQLVTNAGEVAASWSFSGLLAHWSRKHTRAVYVPSIVRLQPNRQYAYGPLVRLAQETDALRLLSAFASGEVFYDPGLKIEHAFSTAPKPKKRNQFRIISKNIDILYKTVEVVEV